MSKKAIITGITGQDGSYLAELLLEKNYAVIGCYRRSSTNSFYRIKHLLKNTNLKLIEFDLTDPSICNQLIISEKPDEFYNLAAQSHVATSFNQPTTTFDINTTGLVNILESIRHFSPNTKIYQASTSEMFGRNYTIKDNNGLKYQNEQTSMLPQSPYGISKLAAHHMIEIYRSGYNIFAVSGILFNHESPRRGENFVTRKITKYLSKLTKGLTKEKLKLGNLDAHRDWGHAKDYVRAMWMMLQHDKPIDLVISTGSTHSVKHFLDAAFAVANIDPSEHIELDKSLLRPAEVDYLCGDSSLALNTINWSPQISFEELINDMVWSDINNETQF